MPELIVTPTTTKKPPFPPVRNYFREDGDEDSTLITTRGWGVIRRPRFIEPEPGTTTLLEQPRQEITFYDITPVEREELITASYQSSLESEEAEATNVDRIKLLARKYARKGLSTEDEARLAIVTERIRRLVPRVATEDFERLAEIAEEIKRIGDEDAELREELGLNEE
jgi:hypothetical protein